MVYKNKNGQPRERAMVAAYSLVTEFGASQKSVGDALGCSQGTVSNWVKEVSHEAEVRSLQNQLNDAQAMILELKEEVLLLEEEVDSEDSYDHYEEEDEFEDYVPDYGFESDEDNWEHALDDVYKANDM
jgi:predicted transcriptional regulator